MGKLVEELKRRKVFRVAAVYAVVAWVLIQVTSTVLPTFNAPDWVNQTFTLLLILGFPITLIVAWAYELTPEGIKPDALAQPSVGPPATSPQPINYIILAIVLLVAGFQVADRFVSGSQSSSVDLANASTSTDFNLSRRYAINIGSTIPQPGPYTNASIALSPDGSKLAYQVTRPGSDLRYLYVQYLDQLPGEQEILQVGDTSNPFFSPDGEWIGMTRVNGLYRMSVRGGSPQLVAPSIRSGTGGFWDSSETIFYTSDERRLVRSSAAGGESEDLGVEMDDSISTQSWPVLLPDKDALLYTVRASSGARDGRVDLLVQSTGEVRTIVRNGYNARYVPTGHIVFVRAAALWAVPFDADRLETNGPERPIIQDVQTDSLRGSTPYAFSDDGLLVYLPGEDTKSGDAESSLIWVDRDGNEEALPELRDFRMAEISPDGQRIAVMVHEYASQPDIWTYDLTRNTLSRLTFDESADFVPRWTPDGERIVFGSDRLGGGLWWQPADGTGLPEVLLPNNPSIAPFAFTPDGAQLLYSVRGDDIFTLTPGNEVVSQPLIQTEFSEGRPDLSADGRWIAYESNETGRDEIYVRPFPDIDEGKWQVSSEGGRMPKWAPDGTELFFRGGITEDGSSVWSTRVETETTFQSDAPTLLFSGNYRDPDSSGSFDISPDGSRFLLQTEPRAFQQRDVTLLVAVDNWFEELKRMAPPDPQ
jgi:serine/threonine-protein kinase